MLSYTTPTLCHYSYNLKKSWFVYFDIINKETGQKIRKQFRSGINVFSTKTGRLRQANEIIEFWKSEIKLGYNPFEKEKPTDKLGRMSLKEAVDFGLSKCEVATKTRFDYACTARFFNKAAETLRLSSLPVSEVKRMHVKLILEEAKKINKWSNTAYNRHLNRIQAILTRVVSWEIIESNPAHQIASLPVTETEKYVPYTEAEKKAIQEHLQANHYKFYIFLMVIYQTGIRPKEVLSLKVKDIDLINMQITILPLIDDENSKTKKIRKVPINKHLMFLLKDLELNKYPKHYYVFGSSYTDGSKVSATDPDFFNPSARLIKRDTVTKLWKKIVKDELGIDKYMYSMKHVGANDKILAGISMDALQSLYGHSSKLMTQKYATVIRQVYADEVIEKSPKF